MWGLPPDSFLAQWMSNMTICHVLLSYMPAVIGILPTMNLEAPNNAPILCLIEKYQFQFSINLIFEIPGDSSSLMSLRLVFEKCKTPCFFLSVINLIEFIDSSPFMSDNLWATVNFISWVFPVYHPLRFFFYRREIHSSAIIFRQSIALCKASMKQAKLTAFRSNFSMQSICVSDLYIII